MVTLIFLLVSIGLAIISINVIPLGLIKKEKSIIAVSSSIIGTLGVLFTSFASLWQAIFIMFLLVISVGYIIATRFSSAIASDSERERLNDNASFVTNRDQQSSTQENTELRDDIILQPSRESGLKIPKLNPLPILEEDVSFLEERNKIPEERLDIDEIQVIDFENEVPLKADKWLDEVETDEIFAANHS